MFRITIQTRNLKNSKSILDHLKSYKKYYDGNEFTLNKNKTPIYVRLIFYNLSKLQGKRIRQKLKNLNIKTSCKIKKM